MRPPTPRNEAQRLAALRRFDVLDTPPEADFDSIVALASSICETPVSLVTLIDAERQWFKAKIGVAEDEAARDVSFCAYAIMGKDLMVVPDTRRDSRFADNPVVATDPGVRFYAGAPLITSDGFGLGTLCVVDHEPRRLTLDQLRALRALGRQVTAQLELNLYATGLGRAAHRLREAERLASLIDGELREPLARLGAYLDELVSAGEPAPETAAGAATAARQHAPALRELVGDLAALADADDTPVLRMREVDLTLIAQRAVEAVRPIAHIKHIWIVNYAGPPMTVVADPALLQQALMHLLFAAVKYTPENGRLRVCVQAEGGPAIRIDDLDLPDAGRPRLFDHLYYGAIAHAPDGSGRDRGLAATKQIFDAHHATLALSDRPGDGTSLHVVFPPVE